MSLALPDNPDNPEEETDYGRDNDPLDRLGQYSDGEDSDNKGGSGFGPKDTYDLKEKLAGNKTPSAGPAAEGAASKGATGAAQAGEAALGAEGAGTAATSTAAGVGEGLAGAAASTAVGTGAGTAVGAGGGGAGGGAVAGGVAGLAGGPAAPITSTAGAIAGAAGGAVASTAATKGAQEALKKAQLPEEDNAKKAGCLVAIVGGLAFMFPFFALGIAVIAIFSIMLPIFGGGTSAGEAADGGPAGGGSSTPGAPRGCPMKGRINTPYGFNISGYVDNGWHYGVDLGDGPGTGTELHSTLEGNASLDSSPTGGLMVVITNPSSGYTVKYLHMSEVGRVTGPVKVGDIIGKENNTGGKTTGEHLHYEVYKDGQTVNPIDYMPAEINYVQPGNNDFTGVLPSGGIWGTCNVLPQDASEVPVGETGYTILYGDTSIVPANPDRIKETANNNFPGNNINAPCPGGVSCWDYVIGQSRARGISPAFAIAIWWEEGGFGGAGANSEFGCFPGGDVSQKIGFQQAFDCFLNFTAVEHPYNSANPAASFTEWAKYFCGPGAVPICSNNPVFLKNLASIYDSVAPGKRVTN